jgi:hypothetical protein
MALTMLWYALGRYGSSRNLDTRYQCSYVGQPSGTPREISPREVNHDRLNDSHSQQSHPKATNKVSNFRITEHSEINCEPSPDNHHERDKVKEKYVGNRIRPFEANSLSDNEAEFWAWLYCGPEYRDSANPNRGEDDF